MVKTKTPGVYKRGNRYVVVWRDRGTQHQEFFPTLALAREAKGKRDGGDRKPSTGHTFEAYALDWIVSYRGRTRGGLADSTRAAYRDSLERFALPFFGRVKLADVDAPMVREFVASMEASGQSAGSIRKHYAPLREAPLRLRGAARGWQVGHQDSSSAASPRPRAARRTSST